MRGKLHEKEYYTIHENSYLNIIIIYIEKKSIETDTMLATEIAQAIKLNNTYLEKSMVTLSKLLAINDYKLLRLLIKKMKEGMKIYLVGHSLGGVSALYIHFILTFIFQYKNLETYIFGGFPIIPNHLKDKLDNVFYIINEYDKNCYINSNSFSLPKKPIFLNKNNINEINKSTLNPSTYTQNDYFEKLVLINFNLQKGIIQNDYFEKLGPINFNLQKGIILINNLLSNILTINSILSREILYNYIMSILDPILTSNLDEIEKLVSNLDRISLELSNEISTLKKIDEINKSKFDSLKKMSGPNKRHLMDDLGEQHQKYDYDISSKQQQNTYILSIRNYIMNKYYTWGQHGKHLLHTISKTIDSNLGMQTQNWINSKVSE